MRRWSRRSSASSNGINRNVQVMLRVRPFAQKELDGDGPIQPIVLPVLSDTGHCNTVTISSDRLNVQGEVQPHEKHFHFDKVFWSVPKEQYDCAAFVADQAYVYEHVGAPAVDNAFHGFNSTILAYGQTGSGKTYTMMGDGEFGKNPGIAPRLCEELFKRKAVEESTGSKQCRIKFSFLEIYREKVRDLMVEHAGESSNPTSSTVSSNGTGSRSSTPNRSRSSSLKGDEAGRWNLEVHLIGREVKVKDLTLITVDSWQQVNRLIKEGNNRRVTASTAMNCTSSRSHGVVQLYLEINEEIQGYRPKVFTTRSAHINIVDLAGSENSAQAKTSGESLQEGISINQSLLQLGLVIEACSKGQFPPTRDSALTCLLHDALGGNSLTYMIATVGPSAAFAAQTLHTLRMSKARHIVNYVVADQDHHEVMKYLAPNEASGSVDSEAQDAYNQLQQKLHDEQQVHTRKEQEWKDEQAATEQKIQEDKKGLELALTVSALKNAALKTQQREAQQQLGVAKTEADELKKHAQETAEMLESEREQRKAMSKQADILQRDLQNANNTIAELQKALKAKNNDADNGAQLHQRVLHLTEENGAMHNRLDQKTQQNDKLKGDIENLRLEVKQANAKIRDAQNQAAQDRQTLRDQLQRHHGSTDIDDISRTRIHEFTKEVEQLQLDKAQLLTTITEVEINLNRLQIDNDVKDQKLGQYEDEQESTKAQLKKLQVTNKYLEDELNQNIQEMTRLQSSVTQLSDDHASKSNLAQKIADLEIELDNKNRTLCDMDAENTLLADQLEACKQRTITSVHDEEKMIELVGEANRSKQAKKRADEQVSALQKENKELEITINELRLNVQNIVMETKHQKVAECNDLTAKLNRLEQENRKLKLDNKSLGTQINNITEDRDSLEKQLEAKRREDIGRTKELRKLPATPTVETEAQLDLSKTGLKYFQGQLEELRNTHNTELEKLKKEHAEQEGKITSYYEDREAQLVGNYTGTMRSVEAQLKMVFESEQQKKNNNDGSNDTINAVQSVKSAFQSIYNSATVALPPHSQPQRGSSRLTLSPGRRIGAVDPTSENGGVIATTQQQQGSNISRSTSSNWLTRFPLTTHNSSTTTSTLPQQVEPTKLTKSQSAMQMSQLNASPLARHLNGYTSPPRSHLSLPAGTSELIMMRRKSVSPTHFHHSMSSTQINEMTSGSIMSSPPGVRSVVSGGLPAPPPSGLTALSMDSIHRYPSPLQFGRRQAFM